MNCPNCYNPIPHKIAWKLNRIKVFPCPKCGERLTPINFKKLNIIFGILGFAVTYFSFSYRSIPGFIFLLILFISWFAVIPYFITYKSADKH